MTSRRAARGTGKAAGAGPMPTELMMGPCIEVWAGEEPKPAGAPITWPAFRACEHWQAAVKEWAVESGWATKTRSPWKALDLARTRVPWSRAFLLARDMGELVDYFEGTRATHPKA